jgi:hypothetical protein
MPLVEFTVAVTMLQGEGQQLSTCRIGARFSFTIIRDIASSLSRIGRPESLTYSSGWELSVLDAARRGEVGTEKDLPV